MSSHENPVEFEKNGPVMTIIINRPHARNAVDSITAHALVKAFEIFEDDEESKVAVLCGNGGTFCAGADLKEFSSSGRRPLYSIGEGPGPMGPSRMQFKKPVIAAVSGFAVAGGLELSILCDLRVVEEDAVFGVFCRRWGVPLIDGGTVRLPRLIGLSRALDMILTGRPVSAQEALQIGLANRVVPKGKAREEAEKLALEISKFPQECMKADRQSAFKSYDITFDEALKGEYEGGLTSLQKEGSEGASRFAKGLGRHGSFAKL